MLRGWLKPPVQVIRHLIMRVISGSPDRTKSLGRRGALSFVLTSGTSACRWSAAGSTLEESELVGSLDGRDAAMYVELSVDGLDVGLHGIQGDEQSAGDLLVRVARG